jgi:uncharacterized protein (TIGR02598 family)
VLAVGVIAFAFVAIMGLIPAGLQQFRQAMDSSVGSQIAQRIIQDAQLSDFDTLVDLNNLPQNTSGYYTSAKNYSSSDSHKTNPIYVRYFDEQGNEIVPQGARLSGTEAPKVVYWATTRIAPSIDLPGSTVLGGNNPTTATLYVQVAFNPGNFDITPSQGTNWLFNLNDPRAKNMPLRTFCAQVGRND